MKCPIRGINAAFFSEDRKYVFGTYGSKALAWEMATGKVVSRIIGYTPFFPMRSAGEAQSSLDGKYVLTGIEDTVKIWDVATGKIIRSLVGHTDGVGAARFSPDSKRVVTISNDKTGKIWEITSGALVQKLDLTEHSSAGWVSLNPAQDIAIQFSPDGKYMVTASEGDAGIAKIWELASGKLVRRISGLSQGGSQGIDQSPYKNSVEFSPNSKYLVTTAFNATKIWEVASGKLVQNLTGRSVRFGIVQFSPGLNYFASTNCETDGSCYSKIAHIRETVSGKVMWNLSGHSDDVWSIQFSPDGKQICTASFDKTAKIWDGSTGRLIRNLTGHSEAVWSAEFSPDGKRLLTASNKSAKIWDVETEKMVLEMIDVDAVDRAHFSADGRFVVTASSSSVKVWDASNGKLVNERKAKSLDGRFSPDGQYVILTSEDSLSYWSAKIWNLTNGKIEKEWGHLGEVRSPEFSSNGKHILISREDNDPKVWDVATGNLVWTLTGHSGQIRAKYSSDGRYIISSSTADPKIVIWDAQTGKEFLTWISVDSLNWVVTHPSGLFDASLGAMDKLYFAQGLDVIEFGQLKARFYEPGLWKKVITGEKLRNVVGMRSIDLPPDIEVSPVNKGYLPIKLINRGGGIGQVNIYINGKEIIQDAREKNTNSKADVVQLKVYIGNHKNIIKGTENYIAVKAWNADHWVVSRGQMITYDSKEIETHKPAIHILSCGVSDYTGTEIDLKYAAKDAEDVSKAITLGAKQLFGIEKSYVYTLTTDRAKEFYPTKATILKTLKQISSTAHPLDVFVMYISGHGINYGGAEGDWHYLTQDAYSANGSAYNDPAIRNQTTLSSNELVELFKKVPALKQVLMIDACASGKVVENLMTQKDINSNTLRALDRMRDRTGMHIITGCTADAVSYEASKYGQGVLTYSILEGIRGAALREEQYIDINKLFQYAQDRVPVLAEGIGGIQSPQVFSPQGSQSFDIGLLTDAEKKEIPIAKIRPVYIRSNFQDETELEDVLGLGKIIDEVLNEVSSKGSESKLIFVDVKEYPEGCKLIGRYQKVGQTISLKLKKKCGDQVTNHDLKAENMDQLKIEILKLL